MKSFSSALPKLLLFAVPAVLVAAAVVLTVHAKRDLLPAARGFQDVASEAGLDFKMAFLPGEQGEEFKINLYDHGCGLAIGDYDGDDREDVLFLNQLGPNGLYRNVADWQFANVKTTQPAVGLDDRVCVGGAFADFDNDGDQDLYVTSTRGGNVLFENQDGRFQDITAQAGVECVAHSQTAAFFDCDNDGDLDLFVTNTAKWTSEVYLKDLGYYEGPTFLWKFVESQVDFEPNILFLNNGDRTFTNVTEEAGLKGKGWSGDVSIFDYDEDGDLDLFVTNMFGLSQLYANDGHGKFEDVTDRTLRRTSYGAIGSKAFDYNNDGRLDLFIADMHSDMWMEYDEESLIEPTKKYGYWLGRKPDMDPRRLKDEYKLGIDYLFVLFGNTLFRNDGGGKFTERSDAAGLETFWPWGVAVGDFDNDGDEDIFLPSGMGYPFFYHGSYLMMNRGDGTFVNAAAEHGIEPPTGGRFLPEKIGGKAAARSSRCAATADFDRDGRLDIVVNNFNDGTYLFRNRFPQRNFAEFRLVGTKSNRDAIGAVMTLKCGDRTLVRQVQASGGYLSQSSKILHFGLGDSDRIDHAEIRWPSGVRQPIDPPPAINQIKEIHEPE
ncbi:MAG TPA: CRTAC1 family protein [Pirellulales bacterium]|nr:CRTAC1 family protein [Pirellulales bacterium]